ncbi:MAG: ParB/RepB/Spo0J family partition protein, partial [Alphaproteobacteria bacterium]|nr:ParB/RepB/Spo0J family partition protein [Alphaproteobacteria bacterium]
PEKRNLGRGLAALFGEEGGEFAAFPPGTTIRTLPVSQLRPGPVQPRRNFDDEALGALVDSVREKGVLQPLLVRRVAGGEEQYEIIAGERRWRAAQIARVHEVPVVEREMDDAEALEVALVENIQRQDLTALEEAEGYKRLMEEFGHSQEDLGRAVGKSRSHVANMLRLLGLPEAVKQMVDKGDLSAGHARALLGAADAVALARDVVRRGLNVRQTERLVAREKTGAGRTGARGRGPARPLKDADTLALERDLSTRLGLAVDIALKGEGGEVTVRFQTLEQLDDLIARLKRDPAPPDGPQPIDF